MTVILVVATIIFFLTMDWFVQRVKAKNAFPAEAEPRAIVDSYPVRVPKGVFFARSHTWLSLFPSGRVRLGVDDFVGSVLDHPEISFMRAAGEKVEKGDPLLVFSDGGRRLVVRTPISGEIVSLNHELRKNPLLMRDSLFSNGWAYTLKPENSEELRSLMLGEESRSWMKKELRRLRDVIIGLQGELAPAAALQDGGAPVTGVLKHLNASAWKKFEDEFLEIQ